MSKKKSLPNHINIFKNSDTGKDEYYCVPCNKQFQSRTQKYYHYDCDDRATKKHQCEQCEESFSTRSHLNYHLEKHKNSSYQCQKCNKVFSNRMVFKKHTKLHQNSLHHCDCCNLNFRSKETLAAHRARQENNLKFSCTECAKKYATKSALEQHKLKHKAKKHKCPHCEKYFQRNSILSIHLKKHQVDIILVCTVCSKKFRDNSALQRHSKTHANDNVIKYRCNDCNIITTRKDNMQRHVKNMHIGKDFVKCVEILKPTTELTHNLNHVSTVELSLANESSTNVNLPKTVANSSVIKCIGNVEPVFVPNECEENHDEAKEERTFTVLKTVRDLKIKKKYDPIEMYRKILNSDEHEEQTEQSSDEPIGDIVPTMTKRNSNLPTSNFSETHWRKNFKYTYTQDQGY